MLHDEDMQEKTKRKKNIALKIKVIYMLMTENLEVREKLKTNEKFFFVVTMRSGKQTHSEGQCR